jgi:hypothetical protein
VIASGLDFRRTCSTVRLSTSPKLNLTQAIFPVPVAIGQHQGLAARVVGQIRNVAQTSPHHRARSPANSLRPSIIAVGLPVVPI